MICYFQIGKEEHSMTMSTQKASTLSGPRLVQALLEELSMVVRRNPDHEVEGMPREIIEEVVMRTDRFSDCSEKCIDDLSRQLAMAVRAKGRPFHLRYEMLTGGRIKVAFA